MRTVIFIVLALTFASWVSYADRPAQLSSQEILNEFPQSLKSISHIENGLITSITGQLNFFKELEIEPSESQEVLDVVKHLDSMGDRKLVIGAGNYKNIHGVYQGLSIGSHAQGMAGDIYLTTKSLKTHQLSKDQYEINHKTNTISLWVKGGNTWQETMDLANSTLSTNDFEHYEYVPLSAPTSRTVSIAGSLTSHGHSRTTAFGGAYMPDAVEAFKMVAIQGGRPKLLTISKTSYPELFYTIPGSFGRGGIIVEVKLNLQRIPKDTRVLSLVIKYKDYETAVKDFNTVVKKNQNDIADWPSYQRPFVSSYLHITSRGRYYIYQSWLVTKAEAKGYPYFDFFEKPGKMTSIMQAIGHKCPRLSGLLIDAFQAGACGKAIYKNKPVNWIFVQDSYLKYLNETSKPDNPIKIAHQAYVLPKSRLAQVLKIAKKLQHEYSKKYGIVAKMEDVVPVPAANFLMAPAYQAEEEQVVYTFTWPITKNTHQDGVLEFRKAFLEQCEKNPEIGPNVVKSHMLKEFEEDSTLLFDTYSYQIGKLENILHQYELDDSYLWNRVFGTLYQIGRG